VIRHESLRGVDELAGGIHGLRDGHGSERSSFKLFMMFENLDIVMLFLDHLQHGRLDFPGYGVNPPVVRLVGPAGGDAPHFQFRISSTLSLEV